MKFSSKSFIARALLAILCLVTCALTIVNPVSLKNTPIYSCSTYAYSSFPSLSEIIKGWFKKEEPKQTIRNEKVEVYLGGYPLGFMLSCSGVVVVAISNESASQLKEGDILTKIEGIDITSSEQILRIINSEEYAGKELNITFVRKSEEHQGTLTPVYDEGQKIYKLGLWVRDNSAGVGTLTYIRKDNLRFGALGHPVCDIDTGAMLPVSTGNIFKCNIVGLKHGEKGNPGELKGLFLRNGSVIGNLDGNNKFGVYGTFNKDFLSSYEEIPIEVATRNEVKSGKAKIRCTIEGTQPKEYDIEIVKTYFQSTKDNKSMFIRVTDKELVAKTGGIVQGMSGSPIIQNGKLVGAVTHVFVSDPTKGYGVYADWMIEN